MIPFKDSMIEVGTEIKTKREYASVRRVDQSSKRSHTVESQFELLTKHNESVRMIMKLSNPIYLENLI